MLKNKINYTLLNILIIVAILAVVGYTQQFWLGIILSVVKLILPFILSFIAAYYVYPLSKKLAKKMPMPVAKTVVIFIVTLLFVGMFVLALPVLYSQLNTIVSNISNWFSTTSANISPAIKTRIMSILNGIIGNLGGYASNGFVATITRSLSMFLQIIIMYIAFIYMLFDMEKIRNGVSKIITKHKKNYLTFVRGIDNQLGDYLQGLLMEMSVQFIEYVIFLAIIGHPNWLLLGLMAGIFSIIPYWGGWLVNLLAILLAASVNGTAVVLTLIFVIVISSINAYWILPKIHSHTNDINPLLGIVWIAIMSSLLGALGLLIAMPLYIILRELYRKYNVDDALGIKNKDSKEK